MAGRSQSLSKRVSNWFVRRLVRQVLATLNLRLPLGLPLQVLYTVYCKWLFWRFIKSRFLKCLPAHPRFLGYPATHLSGSHHSWPSIMHQFSYILPVRLTALDRESLPAHVSPFYFLGSCVRVSDRI
jgi:hypothetical protein